MTKLVFGLVMLLALLDVASRNGESKTSLIIFVLSAVCLTLVKIFGKDK